jgi:hypothetical protein
MSIVHQLSEQAKNKIKTLLAVNLNLGKTGTPIIFGDGLLGHAAGIGRLV